MKKLMKTLARLHNNLLKSISDILYLKKIPLALFNEGLNRCEKDHLAKNNFFGTVCPKYNFAENFLKLLKTSKSGLNFYLQNIKFLSNMNLSYMFPTHHSE